MKKVILPISLLFFLFFNYNSSQSFTKIIGDPLTSDANYSEGASWGDINNDGFLDVFVPHLFDDKKNIIFLNNSNGSFTKIENGPVVEDQGSSPGGVFADFDNDGDLDLFVVNYFDINSFLYFNNGDGTFTKITEGEIVNDKGMSFGVSTIDYDNNGYLDIFVVNGFRTGNGAVNFLYKNNGNGTFTKIINQPIVTEVSPSSSGTWCDYDNDGDPDLFVANGASSNIVPDQNFIYQNNNDGTFTKIAASDLGIEISTASNGSWGDFDNDGDFDLFVTNFFGDNNALYRNNGDGTFTKISNVIISNDGGDSVSSTWGDYDNDGDLDLYVTNDFNENNNFYINNGDGTFSKIISGDFVNDGGRSNGATWTDYDNDGDLDIFVPNGQRPITQSNILYRNDVISNNWINIKCVGVTTNRSAVGAKVKAKAVISGEQTWQLRQVSGTNGFNAQNSLNIELGFGDAALIDSLIIDWPSGMQDVYVNIETNKFYKAIEGAGIDPVVTSVQNKKGIPKTFKLSQNYPNPFNPETTIQYEIPNDGLVKLDIYNTLGQKVMKVISEFKLAGSYEVTVDFKGLTSGIYFYVLATDQKVFSKKMTFIK